MSFGEKIKNPLKRDGTNQYQRLPDTLMPDYVQVDERSIDDLLDFAREFSTHLQYYDESNELILDKTWLPFFDKPHEVSWTAYFKQQDLEGNNKLHWTLYRTFLELFQYAQDHLNTLTERHLEFYYQEILGLQEKPATPDQVHILFELNKDNYLLEAGTLLKAGKDETGVDILVPNQ